MNAQATQRTDRISSSPVDAPGRCALRAPAPRFTVRSPMTDAKTPAPRPHRGERQFELLIKAVVDYAIYMLDPGGVITSWNPGAERTKGYAEAEIIGQHFSRFFTPEDQAAGKPAAALAMAHQVGRFEDEGWRIRKDGSRFWALTAIDAIRDADGHIVGYVKITRDMTERRAAQLALAESEQRFRLLVTSVVDHALFMVNRDGDVANWNQGAERITGYRAADIVGRHFSIFYAEPDRAAGKPASDLGAAQAAGRLEAHGWRARKDGSLFCADVVIDPIRDESGALLGFAQIIRDVTEQRALERAKEQLLQAQKMEAVGQLTGGIAHAFNNLLTAILGSLSLIAQSTSDSRAQRFIDTAQRAAGRGARLTGQLLAFARRQTLRPERANVNEVISVFDMLLRHAVGETIGFEVRLDPRVWPVNIDQAQFQSAILNLVVNARDAMDAKGGRLVVETFNLAIDSERAAALGEIEAGPYVVVAVRDTGSGMSPEVKARAIEPFFTTKEAGQGSGLGLSQVYGFARQSQGQIEIDSAPGRGTTVRLYLPALRSAADAPPLEVSKPTGTILVVEDDSDVLEITLETLRSLDYQVHAASNAPEALTILQRDVPIDVLFSDVVMPKGMSGIELAREARLMRPNLRILLSSGYAREALQGRESIPPDLEFISKPYPQAMLAERLRMLMRGAGC
jgi:PAS domain S-box-containing protein